MAEEHRRMARSGSGVPKGGSSYDEVVRHLIVRQEELRDGHPLRVPARPDEPAVGPPRSDRSTSPVAPVVRASARDRDAELGFPVPRRRTAPPAEDRDETPRAPIPASDEEAPLAEDVVDLSGSEAVLDLTGSGERRTETRPELERRLGVLEHRLATAAADLAALREEAAAIRARLARPEA